MPARESAGQTRLPELRALVFLDRPHVPVRIFKEAETRTRRAFGAHLLYLADRHTPPSEFAADGAEIFDDELDSFDRAGLAQRQALAIARYREKHPFASASEINAERTRIRATSPGISRPYYDVTSSASKSVSVLHASLRVAAGQARQAGDHVTAAALDGEAQAIEDALLDSVRYWTWATP